jgi:colanic acid biosynthesis glycosyl transferase WcaI
LRILVVSQYFWPEQFLINELVTDLVKDGHEVVVLTGEPNYPNGDIYPEFISSKDKYNEYNGAKIYRSALLPRGKGKLGLLFNYLSFMLTSSISLYKFRSVEKFDVVFFFQLSPVFSGLAAVIYKKIYKVPLFTWVQDIWPESLSATGQITNRYALNIVGKFVNFVYANSDLILVQSKYFKKVVLLRCNDSSKIEYFPNWADDLFSCKDCPDSSFYTKIPDVFDFVFAGNIGDAQDFNTIIDAVLKIKDVDGFRFVIVGDGRAKEGALKKIELLGLGDKFLFLGAHAIEFMPSVFSKADVLLVSLLDEEVFSNTIPSKVQAYLASGRPILASLGGAGADVILQSSAGLISEPNNPIMLSDKIKIFLSLSDSALNQMGRSGRSYYEKSFEKNMLRKKLTSLFYSKVK